MRLSTQDDVEAKTWDERLIGDWMKAKIITKRVLVCPFCKGEVDLDTKKLPRGKYKKKKHII